MRRNLIYIPRLDDKGYEVHFHLGKVSIGKYGRILMWRVKIDGLYQLNIFTSNNENALSFSSTYINLIYDVCSYVDDSYTWHLWLGHINKVGRILMWGAKIDGLYQLNIFTSNNENALSFSSTYINHVYHVCLYVDDFYI